MIVKAFKVASDNGDSNDWLELPDTYTEEYLPDDKDVANPSELR